MFFGKSAVRRGFTLVEMAVVLVLFGVLVMFAAGMLAPLLRSEIAATQQRDIDKAYNRLIQRIKMSFYDVPLFANLNWDQGKDNTSSTNFTGLSADNYNWDYGRAPLLYSSGYPVYDSNGKGFWLYSGIPVKRDYFNKKSASLASTAGWFDYSRKVCEHTEATITVKECLTKECTGEGARITPNVAFLITTPGMTPKVQSQSVGSGCYSRTGTRDAAAPIALDSCPGGSVNNQRTITIPYMDRYDARFKLITLERLRDEIGCNAGYIIPRSYSPPTVSTSSWLSYVPEGYVGRTALTFAVSHGWPVYWCVEWEHENSKIFRDKSVPQAAPTRIAEEFLGKDIVTASSGVPGGVRGYCLRKSKGIGDVDSKYISFGDSQLIHMLTAPTGLESTSSYNNPSGLNENQYDLVRLKNRGVYHLNLYISDRSDMSKIIDHVTINLVQ
jgi:prepilin-type N-terminal cleavage/methylation domain-containing protein